MNHILFIHIDILFIIGRNCASWYVLSRKSLAYVIAFELIQWCYKVCYSYNVAKDIAVSVFHSLWSIKRHWYCFFFKFITNVWKNHEKLNSIPSTLKCRIYRKLFVLLFVKAMHGEECVGAIVCKLDIHRKVIKRGYIAMLAVDVKYRKRKIGSNLVRQAIQAMVEDDADEVVLETEITNRPALRLYENLGFVRDKRLFRYYLNGVDALRLKLWLRWNSSACLCQ